MLRFLRVLVLAVALCVVATGLLGGGGGILIGSLGAEGERLATITLSASFLFTTTGLGVAMAWHAFRAVQGQQSIAFRPRKAWLLVLAFVLTLTAGQALLSLNLWPEVGFPLFHVMAAGLPPLAILAVVGQVLGGVATWREIILQASSGALLSTVVAFALEMIVILTLILAVVAALALHPAGQAQIQTLVTQLRQPDGLEDPAGFLPLLNSPAIVLVVLIVLAGIIPLIEEGIKAVGVVLLGYRKPSRPQAFLWGLACGAGFALIEGSFNTIGDLQSWAPVMLLRVGATLMHCLTGALMGLAWYNILAQGRWGEAIGLYAASVSIHAVWNGLTTGMALISPTAYDPHATGKDLMVAGLSSVAILGALIVLTLAMSLTLFGATLRVRRKAR